MNDTSLSALIDKFAAAEASWYGSVRPDGRVHLAPIWHVWFEHYVFVVTQPTSIRAQNLRHNQSVSLSLPDPINVLIIEGWADQAPNVIEPLKPRFQTKYKWDISSDAPYSTIIWITPSKLIAWGSHDEGRWRFDKSSFTWLKKA